MTNTANTVEQVGSAHGTRTIVQVGREHVATCDHCGREVARGRGKRAVVDAAKAYSSRHAARHAGAPDPSPRGAF